MRRQTRWIALLVIALLLAACASTSIGKAVQAADVQKQLVVEATRQMIRLNQAKKMSDADLIKVHESYTKWAAAEYAMSESLAAWKTVASAPNEQKLTASLEELRKLTDIFLKMAGQYVNIAEIQRRLSK